MADLLRLTRGHRQQLGLARALHRDEPEGRFVDRLADREQAVVLVDRRLAGGEGGGQLLAGVDVEHHRPALRGDHGVILVEDARVLGQRVEGDAQRAERLAVHRVRVRRGNDVGARLVDRRVDHERGSVDRCLALDHLTLVVDEEQIADAHLAEAPAEGVDPEVVGTLRITHRDVPGNALGKAELAEDAQRSGELGLAVSPLVGDVVERRRTEHGSTEGGAGDLRRDFVTGRRRRDGRFGDGHHLTLLPASSASGGAWSLGRSNTAR